MYLLDQGVWTDRLFQPSSRDIAGKTRAYAITGSNVVFTRRQTPAMFSVTEEDSVRERTRRSRTAITRGRSEAAGLAAPAPLCSYRRVSPATLQSAWVRAGHAPWYPVRWNDS